MTTKNGGCPCCGRAIARRWRSNAKLRRPHKCPHRLPCPGGDWRYGAHANGPKPPRFGGCPACWDARAMLAERERDHG